MSGRMIQLVLRTLDCAGSMLPWRRRPDKKLEVTSEAAHLTTGRRGEEEAYFYLRRLGYVMVARNWRSSRQRGEIDLIGWDGDVLCFIEVKSRTTRDVKPAEAAVDAAKQDELGGMAGEYLRHVAG